MSLIRHLSLGTSSHLVNASDIDTPCPRLTSEPSAAEFLPWRYTRHPATATPGQAIRKASKILNPFFVRPSTPSLIANMHFRTIICRLP